MRHQYGISVLFSQMSFGGETSVSVAKCWLFAQATHHLTSLFVCFWHVASHDIHQTDSLPAGYKHCSTYSVKLGSKQSMQIYIKLEYFAYTFQKYCITDMPRA